MTITPNDLRSLADDAERQGSSLCAWKLRLAADALELAAKVRLLEPPGNTQ